MKKIWFTEQNVTCFSASIFDKHVLGQRSHHWEQKFANWKKPFNFARWFPPSPYYSFHETPGDIVHTLLTAFTPLLFLCYPYPSLRHSFPGGNTQKSYICKGCQCWLLDNCWKAKGPSPDLQLGWFKLLPEGPAPPWPTRQDTGI